MARETDWEAIEREYRAGQLSVVEIGRQYGVSHTAINKRAKKFGWQRDLAKQVRQAVSAALVSAEVSATNTRETIKAAGLRGAAVVMSHRPDISSLRGIADRLTVFLETMLDDLQQNRIVDVEVKIPGTKDTEILKVPAPGAWIGQIDRESAGDLLRKLSDVTVKLIPLERQAFNLDEPGSGEGERYTDEQKRKAAGLYLED